MHRAQQLRRVRTASRILSVAIVALGWAVATGCGKDSTTPNVTATAVVAVSGGGQSALPGVGLAAPLVAKVTNSDGQPVQGVVVTFSATGGGQLGNITATTNAQGEAQTTYVLGFLVGVQTVTATVTGVSTPATFSVIATLVANPVLTVVSGNNQTAVRATEMPAPLVVRVEDGAGHALSGVVVTWSASAGVVGSTSTTTDGDGRTQVYYTLPNAAGANTITATVGGSTTVIFTATGT